MFLISNTLQSTSQLVSPTLYNWQIEAAGCSILEGEQNIPKDTNGIIIFAHGSGSGRNSPRNKYVAEALQKDGLATLLVDLLTANEEESDTRAQNQLQYSRAYIKQV